MAEISSSGVKDTRARQRSSGSAQLVSTTNIGSASPPLLCVRGVGGRRWNLQAPSLNPISLTGIPRLAPRPSTVFHRLPSVIMGTHAIIYAEDAEQTRVFFRDVLDFSNIDAHNGWLIFKLPPAELGIHPMSGEEARRGRHEIYLMCDDIDATVAELRGRGVEFLTSVEDRGFGLMTTLRVPGGGEVGLYEPKHPTAYDL